jgi:microsomal dipeptidase-like Zn-dependent dipeptidase
MRGDGKHRGRSRAWGSSALLALAVALLVLPSGAPAASTKTRYSLVGGCYGLRSAKTGEFLAKTPGGYEATAPGTAQAELFRMQATDLGSYLLYGEARDFLAISSLGQVEAASQPSPRSDWIVKGSKGVFQLTSIGTGQGLVTDSHAALDVGAAAAAEKFTFVSASGCPKYPEVEINATGKPARGKPSYGEVSGLVEGHMHGMAFEFLGGRAHCGRPWSRYGAPYALVDCPDHYPNGAGAVLENTVSFGSPVGTHDPVGWPTFKDWPDPESLTHEQSYYRWIERSWRGGLRIYVNLLVENRALCELYPLKKNSCDEMDSVYLQARDIYKMQDYIDAQAGGPGKGFFRIVKNPYQARRVANRGKLAVILGMEVSEPFGCSERNHVPKCDEADIVRELDHLHRIGVRQLEITNKFDNALTGVAGDSGSTGTITNSGNYYITGHFWDMEHCDDPANSDRAPETVHNDDAVISNGLAALLAPGATPVYPSEPLCNKQGLTNLGAFAIRQIMKRKMIFDPDHMSVYARDEALNLVESHDYSGIISSHSWSTLDTLSRIYALGGMVTPYAGNSEDFVEKWHTLLENFTGKQYFGVGYGADMNGLGHQGEPRGANVPNPVKYPFKNFDGTVTLDHQVSGERVFDINTDGVAHYGLYPDWIEDLRMLAGRKIIKDMGRGAEAYLQMWERADGIRPVGCDFKRGFFFTGQGLGHQIRLGDRPSRALRRAGQPVTRTKTWRWCIRRSHPERSHRKVSAVFGGGRVTLVASTLPRHRAGEISPGMPASALRGSAHPLGHGFWGKRADHGSEFIYGTRHGKVSFTGVTKRSIAERPGALLKLVKRSRIR